MCEDPKRIYYSDGNYQTLETETLTITDSEPRDYVEIRNGERVIWQLGSDGEPYKRTVDEVIPTIGTLIEYEQAD